MCQCDGNDFSARAQTSGDTRTLTVEGECFCSRAGFRLELEPDNPGIVPQPKDVVLRLNPIAPEQGADVMTLTPLTYITRIGEEAERVIIRLPEGQEAIVLSIADEGGY